MKKLKLKSLPKLSGLVKELNEADYIKFDIVFEDRNGETKRISKEIISDEATLDDLLIISALRLLVRATNGELKEILEDSFLEQANKN